MRHAYPNEMYGTCNGNYLMHYKYIRKVKTSTGKWRYIYDNQKRSNNSILNGYEVKSNYSYEPLENGVIAKSTEPALKEQEAASNKISYYADLLDSYKNGLTSIKSEMDTILERGKEYNKTHRSMSNGSPYASLSDSLKYTSLKKKAAEYTKNIDAIETKLAELKRVANGHGDVTLQKDTLNKLNGPVKTPSKFSVTKYRW